jgi:hypothetical protein
MRTLFLIINGKMVKKVENNKTTIYIGSCAELLLDIGMPAPTPTRTSTKTPGPSPTPTITRTPWIPSGGCGAFITTPAQRGLPCG